MILDHSLLLTATSSLFCSPKRNGEVTGSRQAGMRTTRERREGKKSSRWASTPNPTVKLRIFGRLQDQSEGLGDRAEGVVGRARGLREDRGQSWRTADSGKEAEIFRRGRGSVGRYYTRLTGTDDCR